MHRRSEYTEPEHPARLTQVGVTTTRWSNGPHAVYGVHEHPYRKVLLVVEGSVTFSLPSRGRHVLMRPDDRLEIPAHTPHSAVVGEEGVVCVEAHQER